MKRSSTYNTAALDGGAWGVYNEASIIGGAMKTSEARKQIIKVGKNVFELMQKRMTPKQATSIVSDSKRNNWTRERLYLMFGIAYYIQTYKNLIKDYTRRGMTATYKDVITKARRSITKVKSQYLKTLGEKVFIEKLLHLFKLTKFQNVPPKHFFIGAKKPPEFVRETEILASPLDLVHYTEKKSPEKQIKEFAEEQILKPNPGGLPNTILVSKPPQFIRGATSSAPVKARRYVSPEEMRSAKWHVTETEYAEDPALTGPSRPKDGGAAEGGPRAPYIPPPGYGIEGAPRSWLYVPPMTNEQARAQYAESLARAQYLQDFKEREKEPPVVVTVGEDEDGAPIEAVLPAKTAEYLEEVAQKKEEEMQKDLEKMVKMPESKYKSLLDQILNVKLVHPIPQVKPETQPVAEDRVTITPESLAAAKTALKRVSGADPVVLARRPPVTIGEETEADKLYRKLKERMGSIRKDVADSDIEEESEWSEDEKTRKAAEAYFVGDDELGDVSNIADLEKEGFNTEAPEKFVDPLNQAEVIAAKRDNIILLEQWLYANSPFIDFFDPSIIGEYRVMETKGTPYREYFLADSSNLNKDEQLTKLGMRKFIVTALAAAASMTNPNDIFALNDFILNTKPAFEMKNKNEAQKQATAQWLAIRNLLPRDILYIDNRDIARRVINDLSVNGYNVREDRDFTGFGKRVKP